MVMGTLLSIIPMLIYENPVFPVDVKHILFLCGMHVSMFLLMPVWLLRSLLVSGSVGFHYFYQWLIIVLIAQYTFLEDIHPGHRNWTEIVGMICVLFGSNFSSLLKYIKLCRWQKCGKRSKA